MPSSTPSSLAGITFASAARFVELVRKIETSPKFISRRRRSKARKKVLRVTKEHRRQAKSLGYRAVALTLTYKDRKLFNSKHISRFIDLLRSKLKRMGHTLMYAWVLECAATLHYHLIIWLPRGFRLDPAQLEKWWPWGSTWIEACESVNRWSRYMTKFETPPALIPAGARLYGYGGLDVVGKAAVVRAGLPRWLVRVLPAGAIPKRLRGGGWFDPGTGEAFLSPYKWGPWGFFKSPSES